MGSSSDREASAYRNRPRRWVFLTGDRRSIAALLSAAIFLSLLAVGTTWELQMENLVTETRAVQTLFNTLLGGVILFVSVVLTLNVAVLAEEFGPLRTKQTQVEESIQFQTELEHFTESGVSSANIREFVLLLLDLLHEEANELRETSGGEDEAVARQVAALGESVASGVTAIEARHRSRRPGTAPILLAGLRYDYARHISEARRIRWTLGDRLSNDRRARLDDLVELLTLFGSSREYFTTLYYRREIRNLSGSLLVLSLPVIVFTAFVLLAIDAGLFPTVTVLEIQPRLLYVSTAFVVALSPYVLLSSYMLRILTVSKYSLKPSGFTFEEVETTADDS